MEREHGIQMTKQDAKIFFDATENPPPLNEKMLASMKLYQEVFPTIKNRGVQKIDFIKRQKNQ